MSSFEIFTKVYLDQKEKQAIQEVVDEYCKAVSHFGEFNSAHEGWAIIYEELDELWEEVRAKQGERNEEGLKKEATQVAAMGLRFLVDVVLKNKGFK